jgi:hypothetical protein
MVAENVPPKTIFAFDLAFQPTVQIPKAMRRKSPNSKTTAAGSRSAKKRKQREVTTGDVSLELETIAGRTVEQVILKDDVLDRWIMVQEKERLSSGQDVARWLLSR